MRRHRSASELTGRSRVSEPGTIDRLGPVGRLGVLFVLGASLAVSSSGPARGYVAPGSIDHVLEGAIATGLSADGRLVAFHTSADDLVPGDENRTSDVFVLDRETGEVERVSVAGDGAEGNRTSSGGKITPDGRFVTFSSLADNLVPGDTNEAYDVFIHDRLTGGTERVSLAGDGSQGELGGGEADVSADGRYVSFVSSSSDLVAGDTNGFLDVFVRDRATGMTERVSVASDGSQAESFSKWASISDDGRMVAFYSLASNLVPRDTNLYGDIFVHDRVDHLTHRVSVSTEGREHHSYVNAELFGRSAGPSTPPVISGNGRFVAFASNAGNASLYTGHVPDDDAGWSDIFVHDLETGVTERVSVTSDGRQAELVANESGTWTYGNSFGPSISDDGRHVAFWSEAATLTPDDTNEKHDVFVHDRLTGITERVSVAEDGSDLGKHANSPVISGDGRHVVFQVADSFSEGIGVEVLHSDRGPGVGVGALSASAEEGAVNAAGWASFSGAVVTAATDPLGDALPPGYEVGGEILRASLVLRPEREDLLFRMRVATLPWNLHSLGETCVTPAVCGVKVKPRVPGPVYGLEFTLDGVRHEVRATRSALGATWAASGGEPVIPFRFGLYRCEPVCLKVAQLAGSIGQAGQEVWVTIPMDVIPGASGSTLAGLRAYAAAGDPEIGGVADLDEVFLPAAPIPVPSVGLGIAEAGTPQEDVAFDVYADLSSGSFSGTLAASARPAGQYDVWARGCLGEECGGASKLVSIGG